MVKDLIYYIYSIKSAFFILQQSIVHCTQVLMLSQIPNTWMLTTSLIFKNDDANNITTAKIVRKYIQYFLPYCSALRGVCCKRMVYVLDFCLILRWMMVLTSRNATTEIQKQHVWPFGFGVRQYNFLNLQFVSNGMCRRASVWSMDVLPVLPGPLQNTAGTSTLLHWRYYFSISIRGGSKRLSWHEPSLHLNTTLCDL